jgi:hypothetical protein
VNRYSVLPAVGAGGTEMRLEHDERYMSPAQPSAYPPTNP